MGDVIVILYIGWLVGFVVMPKLDKILELLGHKEEE